MKVKTLYRFDVIQDSKKYQKICLHLRATACCPIVFMPYLHEKTFAGNKNYGCQFLVMRMIRKKFSTYYALKQIL